MPFESQAQRAFLYSKHPSIAKRWRKESGPQRGLKKRVSKKTAKRPKQSKGRPSDNRIKSTKSQRAELKQGYRGVK